jgi:hypothetical protein
MSCILIGIVGFALLLVALRPLAPAALRLVDLAAPWLGGMPERELVPIRVDSQPRR